MESLVCTSQIERQNLHMRMQLRRLTSPTGAALLELQLLLDAFRDPLHARDGGTGGAEAATGEGSAGGLQSVVEVVFANVSQEVIGSCLIFYNPNHYPVVIIDAECKDPRDSSHRLESQRRSARISMELYHCGVSLKAQVVQLVERCHKPVGKPNG
jgi:hypothetical protein